MRFAFPLLLALTFIPPAAAAPAEFALPNGVRALLVPDSTAAAVDVALWFAAGTRWEPAGSSGATHLLERMATDGSWSAAESRALGAVGAAGGSHNAYSTSDFASFFVTIPPEGLPVALALAGAQLAGPKPAAAPLARAKAAARAALAQRGDGGPVGRTLARLYAEAFGDHPYAQQVSGDGKERDAIPLARLAAYGAGHYAPGNAVLTIVGRFDSDSARAWVRRSLGAVASRPTPPRPATLPDLAGPRRVETAGEGPFALVAAGWRATGANDPGRLTTAVLSRVLAQGSDSRLARTLLKGRRPIAIRLEGTLAERRDASLIYFVGVFPEGIMRAAADSVILAEAARLAAEPVPEEELERARRGVEMELRSARGTTRGRALAYGASWMLAGRWQAADDDLSRLAAITAEDVREAAVALLKPSSYVSVWAVPASRGVR